MPVALLHVAAFAMGYFICKGLGFNEKTSRTVSIETGAATLMHTPSKEARSMPHHLRDLGVRHVPWHTLHAGGGVQGWTSGVQA